MDESTKPHDGKTKEHGLDVESGIAYADAQSVEKGDILSLEHTDPVLNAKMHLINNVRFPRSHRPTAIIII